MPLMSVHGQQVERSAITCLVLTNDGDTVLQASQSGVFVRDWQSLSAQRRIQLPFTQIHDLEFNDNEQIFYCAGGVPGESGGVAAFSWPAGEQLWHKRLSDDVVYSVAAHKTVLATGLHDHSVRLLDAMSGAETATLNGHSKPVRDVQFLDSKLLLSCSLDQTIRVWNLETQKIERSLNNHKLAVNGMALRPATASSLPMIASCSNDKTVRLWQPTIGRLVRFKRLTCPVSCLTFSTDGQSIIAGSHDGSVHFVNVDTLQTKTIPDVSSTWINCVVRHPAADIILVGDAEGNLSKLKSPQ